MAYWPIGLLASVKIPTRFFRYFPIGQHETIFFFLIYLGKGMFGREKRVLQTQSIKRGGPIGKRSVHTFFFVYLFFHPAIAFFNILGENK